MQSPDKEIDFCLLIPCYNNFEGLITSINSVFYPGDKFLILVVDDGSKEPVTESSVNQAINNSKPVVVIQNEKNLGITATLNNGLQWIEKNTRSKYIARLDCGDICDKERFTIQVEYMNAHPQVGLLGSWCKIVDEKFGLNYSYKAPSDHDSIKRAMYSRNVFMHATVMFRSDMLPHTGYYPVNYEFAEDYAFFWTLLNYKQSSIIPRFLVLCELNVSGISFSNKSKQLNARWRVVKNYGKDNRMKMIGFIRILLLHITPKGLLLRMKKMMAD